MIQIGFLKCNILKINDEIIKPTKKLTLDTLNDFLSDSRTMRFKNKLNKR